MTRVIALREYEQRVVELDDQDARDVATVSNGKLTVLAGPAAGTWLLAPSGWVGAVVTPNVEVLIRPKVPLHNLFLLLDVGLPPDAWRRETFAYGTDPHLLAAMAAFYARAAERALARGVRRDYRAESARLLTLRGRVDVVGQLRTPGVVAPIACRFDEYTADIAENRALKAAVRRLLRLPGVRPDTRRLLERLLAQLEEVADAHVDPASIERIVITRLNRHYEPALRLAALILRNTSLLDRVGTADASAFLLDMPGLFQRWLTDRLRRHLRGRLDVLAERRIHLGAGGKIPMDPDLEFRAGGITVYAGDVKYKLTSDGRGKNADYYQLFAYLTALELPEGVLVYCQADAEPERDVVVANSGKRLWTKLVSLGGSSEQAEDSVRELADWIAERASLPAKGAA